MQKVQTLPLNTRTGVKDASPSNFLIYCSRWRCKTLPYRTPNLIGRQFVIALRVTWNVVSDWLNVTLRWHGVIVAVYYVYLTASISPVDSWSRRLNVNVESLTTLKSSKNKQTSTLLLATFIPKSVSIFININ